MENINKKLKLVKKKGFYHGTFFITGLDIKLELFSIGLIRNNEIVQLGNFSNGLSYEEKQALIKTLTKDIKSSRKQQIKVNPGICIDIQFQSLIGGELIKPSFLKFRLNEKWENCTWGNLLLGNTVEDSNVLITSPDKILWKNPATVKDEYIGYLVETGPAILPFLKNRTLTVLRYPNGIEQEAFYQKNCPDYAPSFVKTFQDEEINYVVCNNFSTLLWLGNQSALEFHVPFNTLRNKKPLEIVFDLDPPSVEHFPLAIKAAKEMKKLFDKFEIKSYPKLSGGKGLQIHIPLLNTPLTYEETRIFTSFIAVYLTEKFPQNFTVERMKKKRGKKLYIDYVQHWSGKTIIAPYSSRGRLGATVAAPLLWEEMNENLTPKDFNLYTVRERLMEKGCPFHDFFKQKNEAVLPVVESLKKKGG